MFLRRHVGSIPLRPAGAVGLPRPVNPIAGIKRAKARQHLSRCPLRCSRGDSFRRFQRRGSSEISEGQLETELNQPRIIHSGCRDRHLRGGQSRPARIGYGSRNASSGLPEQKLALRKCIQKHESCAAYRSDAHGMTRLHRLQCTYVCHCCYLSVLAVQRASYSRTNRVPPAAD